MKWFKNLRIKYKLIFSFAIVMLFSVVLTVMAVMTVNSLDDSYSYLLEHPQKRFEYLLRIDTSCITMRQAAAALVINADDPQRVQSYWEQFEQAYNGAVEYMDDYLENNKLDTVRDPEALKSFNETMLKMKAQLENYRENAKIGMETALQTGDSAAANPIFLQSASLISEVTDTVRELIPQASAYTSDVSDANTKEKEQANLRFAIVLAGIVVLCVVIAAYIAILISRPLRFMSGALEQIGTKGDLSLDEKTAKSARSCAELKDEIGVCARAVGGLIGHLTNVERTLAQVAQGDLTIEVNTLSDRDIIGLSVAKLVDNLNNMFGEINTSTAQVSTGSRQIADGAMLLAQGSTEQASAVEELSASIAEIADKTKANAQMADEAANLSNTIMSNAEKGSRQMDDMMVAVKEINQASGENAQKAGTAAKLAGSIMTNAEKGSRQMEEMITAVKEINEASQSIGKIIKTIDEIAFQTNILAINAAVEAAHAGQHGRGFAVVAEEVRNLASKSADAARETSEMIEGSMQTAAFGFRIAEETAESFADIVSGISESNVLVEEIATSSETSMQKASVGVTMAEETAKSLRQIVGGVGESRRLVAEIARASEEQSEGIEQINKGIDQVAQVVQQNSATAQQSAASSKEMSGQATILSSLVEQFKLK